MRAGHCSSCGRTVGRTQRGLAVVHGPRNSRCPGSQLPAEPITPPPPLPPRAPPDPTPEPPGRAVSPAVEAIRDQCSVASDRLSAAATVQSSSAREAELSRAAHYAQGVLDTVRAVLRGPGGVA